MASQRYLKTKFWDDKYIRDLNAFEKLLFLYFLTNSLTNICGIYEISMERIEFDTKIKQKNIKVILEKFKNDAKMLYSDGWVCIINFIKNQSLNPSVIDGIKRELKLVPRDTLSQFVPGCPTLSQDGTLNLTKLNLTKPSGNSDKKPFYGELPMRKWYGKWQVFDRGCWNQYADRESAISYK